MNRGEKIKQNYIHFFRWTRKKFAVMASLGKIISIGAVRIEICKQALKKSGLTFSALPVGNLISAEDDVPDKEMGSLAPVVLTLLSNQGITEISRSQILQRCPVILLFPSCFFYKHCLDFINRENQADNTVQYAH